MRAFQRRNSGAALTSTTRPSILHHRLAGRARYSGGALNVPERLAPEPLTLLSAGERLDLDEVWVPFRWPGQLGGKDVYLSGAG